MHIRKGTVVIVGSVMLTLLTTYMYILTMKKITCCIKHSDYKPKNDVRYNLEQRQATHEIQSELPWKQKSLFDILDEQMTTKSNTLLQHQILAESGKYG